MSELLPCPFCGGEANLDELTPTPYNDQHSTYYSVGCINCGIGFYENTEDEAIAAWNSRANLGSCENELIVRCENCKHYNRIGCSDGFGWCESMDRGVSDDFYCANGAKMESEGST